MLPHCMLKTLCVLCCAVSEAQSLPIFLDKVVSPVGAIIISVTLILLCAEIIPQVGG